MFDRRRHHAGHLGFALREDRRGAVQARISHDLGNRRRAPAAGHLVPPIRGRQRRLSRLSVLRRKVKRVEREIE